MLEISVALILLLLGMLSLFARYCRDDCIRWLLAGGRRRRPIRNRSRRGGWERQQ